MPGGGARGQNLVHFQNEVFNPYLDNHNRKHSDLDPMNPVGLVFIPGYLTQGSMPGGGARGQNLVHVHL